jgi:hypothetical protein
MITPLDPLRHRRTRVGSRPDLAFAAAQNHAIVGLQECTTAAADYPLVLMKHAETGRFNIVALYGYQRDRNLFVVNQHWHATYVPLATLRYPFFLDSAGALGLGIDEASPCASAPDGHRLFADDGAATVYTMRIADMLQAMQRDFDAMQAFTATLAELKLIRPLALLLSYEDGTQAQIEGLYSVSRRSLAGLSDSDVVALHRRDYLNTAHVVIASLTQMNRLQQLHDGQSPRRILKSAMTLRE